MDYGPFLSYTINCKTSSNAPDNLVLKGIAIKVGASNEATVCFDTELMRYAAGWTGGFLNISNTHLNTYKGNQEAFADGQIFFSTKPQPGWTHGDKSDDPRPLKAGPLPRDWARYKGLYRNGNRVVLHYTVADSEVHETPWVAWREGKPVFVRNITVGRGKTALRLLGEREIPPREEPVTFSIPEMVGPKPIDLCRGGAALWSEHLTTRGRVGFGGPFVVDTLAAPENNPWQSWLRFVAMDFFSDGRAALSTWNGDVWIVSGIDDKLQKLSWKRYAAGLFEPLGLKIVNDQLFVSGRDQITRLHDLNRDGEADHYESFFNENPINSSYHSFTFDLQTDRAGNFYYVRCGQRVEPELPLSGGMVRVAKDGSKGELIAHGLRAANGMSIGPNDQITCADNQGNWVPTSRIDLIKPRRFYGYVPHAHTAVPPTNYEPPLCWIPYQLDNSSGGQIWVTSDKWRPFQGQLLHTSYGKSSLFLVMMERDGERAQGGTVQFPLKFESGIMRGRFHPNDGQLYLCGLKGWQTSGARDGAFHRVRYTGGKVYMPQTLDVTTNGVRIGFTCALQKDSAEDVQNYSLEQWNYLWCEKYGSPEFSVKEPTRQGRDTLELKSARLETNGHSVFLEIPGIRPVMQMKIQFRLKASDGALVAHTVHNTINYLQ
jgi:glucose/arabinose dehydrogenase